MPASTLPIRILAPEGNPEAGVPRVEPLCADELCTFLEWSPDGRRALIRKSPRTYTFVTFDADTRESIRGIVGELWVLDTYSRAQIQIADTADAWAWAPDGRSVLFTAPANPEGGLEGAMFVADLDAVQVHSLGPIELTPNLQWLPTGHVFFAQGSQLQRMRPDGTDRAVGSPVELRAWYGDPSHPEAYEAGIANPRICADESRMAYLVPSALGNTLWVSALDGSDAVRVARSVSYFTWEPDCMRLAYVVAKEQQNAGYGSSIWVVDRTGSNPVEIIPASLPEEANQYPQWVGNKDRIVYGRCVPSCTETTGCQLENQIWYVEACGGNAALLVKNGERAYPSPDGSRIAFNTPVSSASKETAHDINAFIAEITPPDLAFADKSSYPGEGNAVSRGLEYARWAGLVGDPLSITIARMSGAEYRALVDPEPIPGESRIEPEESLWVLELRGRVVLNLPGETGEEYNNLVVAFSTQTGGNIRIHARPPGYELNLVGEQVTLADGYRFPIGEAQSSPEQYATGPTLSP